MKINNWLASALLVLISVLLTAAMALFAIEMSVRGGTFSTSKTDSLRDMVAFHEERGWELKPGNYRLYDPSALTLSSITINSLGMRGKAVQLEASPKRKRVTLVGDSFMFASALDEADTVAYRVQNALGNDYEIVNLKSAGYGTAGDPIA